MAHLPPHIGDYEVLGLLGTGGMAEVFLGRHHNATEVVRPDQTIDRVDRDQPVVVKRILPHLARQQHFVDMFRDEARIAAQIDHRNVVRVYELGEDGDELFLVMEYLGGESAAGIARQLAHRKKLLSFGLCTHLMAEVCAGLHAAHDLVDENGAPLHIVHRDVSPANIFVTYEGGVKILDFGIAVAAGRLSKTDAGQVKGKYAYMSPEQCRGKTLDRRSDIFSLGTVLYEMSTCRRLFKRASDMETLEAVCNETVLPPSQLVSRYPKELERICLKALQKDPEDRYATAGEMRQDLLAVAAELNKDKLPERSLAKVMRRLFGERIEQKKQMLNYLRAGEEVPQGSMPAEEQSIELPVVPTNLGQEAMQAMRSAALAEPLPFVGNTQEIEAQSPSSTAHSFNSHDPSDVPRSQRSGALSVFLLLLLPLVVGLATGVWWTSQNRPVAGAAKPRTVRIELDTIPREAEVFREGRKLGTTPTTLLFNRGDSPIKLTLRKEGYRDLVDTLVPAKDHTLRLSLQPLGEAGPSDDQGRSSPPSPDE